MQIGASVSHSRTSFVQEKPSKDFYDARHPALLKNTHPSQEGTIMTQRELCSYLRAVSGNLGLILLTAAGIHARTFIFVA